MAFLICFLFRYVRLFVSIYAYYTFKPRPLSANPVYTPGSVTVVVATKFSNPPEHIECLNNILRCQPEQLVVVTAQEKYALVSQELTKAGLWDHITLLAVERLNKKLQMTAALKHAVRNEIVCFADDDVQWPSPAFLPTMLACFDDPTVGAAGPKQRVTRQANGWFGLVPNIWHILGIAYIERRNFNTGSCQNIDGGLSTLSGRTSFFRTSIIQNQDFYDYFLNAQNHDDDKNLTRWVLQNWNVALNFSEPICTTVEVDVNFLSQCFRWARGHWRGNFRVMSTTTYWIFKHPWSFYSIYIGQFQTPAAITDTFLFWLYLQATVGWRSTWYDFWGIVTPWIIFVLFTKTVKMFEHFRRYPQDIVLTPFMILFSYYHGLFINIPALFTMNNTTWGSTGGGPAPH